MKTEGQGVREKANTRRKAEIALLKAAYVGVYAKFGYRYILRQCLDRVRAQITEPDKTHVSFCRLWDRDSALPENAILLFHDPVKCVAAKIGKSTVLLPWIDDPNDFWD